MDFEELQKAWLAYKPKPRSNDELRRMMYASPASRFRRVSKKEILEFSGKLIIIITVISLFDLFKNWSSGIFAAWSIFLLLDEYLGLRYLRLHHLNMGPQMLTIRQTLEEALISIRRVALVSRLAHGLIWLSVVLVLGIQSQWSILDTCLMALALLPVLAVANWWTSRKWKQKMAEVNEMLEVYSVDRNTSLGIR